MRTWNVLVLAIFLSQPLLAKEGTKEKSNEPGVACAEEASVKGSERDVASKANVANTDEDSAYSKHLKVIDRMDRIR